MPVVVRPGRVRQSRRGVKGLVLVRFGMAVQDTLGEVCPGADVVAAGDRRYAVSHGWAGTAWQSWSCAAGPDAAVPRLAWSGASWRGSPGRVS